MNIAQITEAIKVLENVKRTTKSQAIKKLIEKRIQQIRTGSYPDRKEKK